MLPNGCPTSPSAQLVRAWMARDRRICRWGLFQFNDELRDRQGTPLAQLIGAENPNGKPNNKEAVANAFFFFAEPTVVPRLPIRLVRAKRLSRNPIRRRFRVFEIREKNLLW